VIFGGLAKPDHEFLHPPGGSGIEKLLRTASGIFFYHCFTDHRHQIKSEMSETVLNILKGYSLLYVKES
jgi:hypothetical protein